MSGFLSVTEIITSDLFKSLTGAIITIAGVFGVFYTAYKFLKKSLNAPIKGRTKCLRAAGIQNWPIRLFAINLSLKTIPINTRSDKIATYGFVTFIIGCLAYLSFMYIQTMRTPENWTFLIHKSSGESFYITHDMAKGSSLLPGKTWEISHDACDTQPPDILSTQIGLSIEMATFICEVFNNKNSPEHLTKSIEQFNHDKLFFYFTIVFIDIALIWMRLSLTLTLYYKNTMRNYIIEQNKKALNYIS